MSVSEAPQRNTESSPAVDALLAPVTWVRGLSGEAKIVLAILTLVSLWGIAILTFGYPAIIIPMKIIVPSMFVGLVLLTWGG